MPFSLLSADGQSKYDVRDGAPMLVGRAPTCDVPVFDPTVSRRHAELSLIAGGVKVTDLGSANGTFVNGEKITGDPPAQPSSARSRVAAPRSVSPLPTSRR